MAATGVQFNITGCTFNGTSIKQVVSVQMPMNARVMGFSGDANLFDTVKALAKVDPKVTLNSADIGTLLGLGVGTGGALAFSFPDAKGVVGGGVAVNIANAFLSDVQVGGQHAQFGTASAHFDTWSSDGVTSPISMTRF